MNLRQNGLMMLLLTALLGIASQWAGISRISNLWALPLALLLLGLAYERLVCARAAMRLSIHSPNPWHLARGGEVRWHLTHSLPRTLTVVLAPHLPAGIDTTTQIRSVQVAALHGDVIGLSAVSARRLGGIHAALAQPARIAGPLGLAWWSVWPSSCKSDHSNGRTSDAGSQRSGQRCSRCGYAIQPCHRPRGANRAVARLPARGSLAGSSIGVRLRGSCRALVSRDFAEDQHLGCNHGA